MLNKTVVFSLAALFVIGVFGCHGGGTMQPVSKLDQNWGRSFEAAKYNQTLNPDADKNLAPVEGLEGTATERIIGEYVKGGRTGPAQPTYQGGAGALRIQ